MTKRGTARAPQALGSPAQSRANCVYTAFVSNTTCPCPLIGRESGGKLRLGVSRTRIYDVLFVHRGSGLPNPQRPDVFGFKRALKTTARSRLPRQPRPTPLPRPIGRRWNGSHDDGGSAKPHRAISMMRPSVPPRPSPRRSPRRLCSELATALTMSPPVTSEWCKLFASPCTAAAAQRPRQPPFFIVYGGSGGSGGGCTAGRGGGGGGRVGDGDTYRYYSTDRRGGRKHP